MKFTLPLFFCTLFHLFLSTNTQACCAEGDERLYPIGEINELPVIVKFNIIRNCKNPMDNGIKFYAHVYCSLLQLKEQNLIILEEIDSAYVEEGTFSYSWHFDSTNIEKTLVEFYQHALKSASSYPSYTPALTKAISFNDSLEIQYNNNDDDYSYFAKISHHDDFSILIDVNDIISGSIESLPEKRSYETQNYILTIYRVSSHDKTQVSIEHTKERFQNLSTAIWKEKSQWHAMSKEHLRVKKKLNHNVKIKIEKLDQFTSSSTLKKIDSIFIAHPKDIHSNFLLLDYTDTLFYSGKFGRNQLQKTDGNTYLFIAQIPIYEDSIFTWHDCFIYKINPINDTLFTGQMSSLPYHLLPTSGQIDSLKATYDSLRSQANFTTKNWHTIKQSDITTLEILQSQLLLGALFGDEFCLEAYYQLPLNFNIINAGAMNQSHQNGKDLLYLKSKFWP